MRLTRPLFLFLLALLPYVIWLGRPRGHYGRKRAWTALLLRCLAVTAIVLGLSGLQTVRGGDELAVVFVLDVSDSIPAAEQQRALDLVGEAIAALPPGDRAALVVFGADALVERPMMPGGELGEVTSIPHTWQTDLEEAVRLGLALFPDGVARRLVIISDGRPTVGDGERAVRLARAQGVQVDVVTLDAPPGTESMLAALDVPAHLRQGEEFTLVATVESSARMAATLTILSGERVISQQAVTSRRDRTALPCRSSPANRALSLTAPSSPPPTTHFCRTTRWRPLPWSPGRRASSSSPPMPPTPCPSKRRSPPPG